jgi:hypothetical protein
MPTPTTSFATAGRSCVPLSRERALGDLAREDCSTISLRIGLLRSALMATMAELEDARGELERLRRDAPAPTTRRRAGAAMAHA